MRSLVGGADRHLALVLDEGVDLLLRIDERPSDRSHLGHLVVRQRRVETAPAAQPPGGVGELLEGAYEPPGQEDPHRRRECDEQQPLNDERQHGP